MVKNGKDLKKRESIFTWWDTERVFNFRKMREYIDMVRYGGNFLILGNEIVSYFILFCLKNKIWTAKSEGLYTNFFY
jgi:uncharacterized protein (DUF1786 family)